MNIPRSEYPRPQFQREAWLNLNGEWSCRFDHGKSGGEQGWMNSNGFENKIQVPFCPESKLSGLAHTDFIEMMWYHRVITIPDGWRDRMILLHFGGVDYECTIYLDGREVGAHTGGISPFVVDLTGIAEAGKSYQLVVMVKDEIRSGNQAGGKQSRDYKSAGCRYTRTTGIWQTVWLEAVKPFGLRQCRIVPDFDAEAFNFIPSYHQVKSTNQLKVKLLNSGMEVASATVQCANGIPVTIKVPDAIAWEPGKPFLYEVVYEVCSKGGEVIDRVESYAGLRKIHIEGDRMFLNNKPLFVRFVLDQGFYEDGIWTAPSDEALKRDIELSMAAGFNGARLHEKIFEERFHYWADRLGYLTWAEFPDCGMAFWQNKIAVPVNYHRSFYDYLTQWRSIVERDANHPSIITWTPFNETRYCYDQGDHNRLVQEVYELTRSLDPTRPVNDTSGYVHVQTDLWTVHNYKHDHTLLVKELRPEERKVFMFQPEVEEVAYKGQPYIVDEYGGVKYIPEGRRAFADNSWGYGPAPADKDEALGRIRALTAALVAMPEVSGYCYTQLTDVEQEQNGIYNYDRSVKLDMAEIFKVFSAKPDWSHY